MALLRGFDRFLLFCRVQKVQHTANPYVCRVPNSSTWQRQRRPRPLGSVNGAMTSSCAAPRHTAKMKVRRVLGCGRTTNDDGVELQRTAVNVDPFRRGLSDGHTAKS